jgi:hypothetical protein
VGIVIGWIVRGRWLLLTGFLIEILAIVVPWPGGWLRKAVLFLGVAFLLAQLVVLVRSAYRSPPWQHPSEGEPKA